MRICATPLCLDFIHFVALEFHLMKSFSNQTAKTIVNRLQLVVLLGAICVMTSMDHQVQAAEKDSSRYIVYVGTYTQTESEGIYRLEFNAETGALKRLEGVTVIENPSFLGIHPNQKYLYAVSEINEYQGKKNSGGVFAYRIEGDQGNLVELNQISSQGGVPCHIDIDTDGKSLLVANYTGGSIVSIAIEEDGKLRSPVASLMQHRGHSINKARQEAAHAHSSNISPDNRFVYALDLGIDQVITYRLDAQTAKLTVSDLPNVKLKPGSGPRHFAFHPNHQFAYVLNELSCEVAAFQWNPKNGKLAALQTITTLPEPTPGNSTAEIRIHPNGKFLYASNRGHHSLAIYRIDQSTGLLTAIGHEPTGGKTPRNFNIDPTGKFILAANQDSNNIVVFRIDEKTGLLSRTKNEVQVPMPNCIRFLQR